MRLIYALTIFSFLSCQNTKENSSTSHKSIKLIELNTEDGEKDIDPHHDTSILLTNTAVIPLESTPDALTAAIDLILINGNYIYAVNTSTELSIHIFHKNGFFIKKIKSLGKGPNEYFNISDISINKLTGDIDILVNNSKKILVYDSIGTFKKSYNLNCNALSRFKHLGNHYVFYKGLQTCDEKEVKRGYSHRLRQVHLTAPTKVVKEFLPFYYKGLKLPHAAIPLNALSNLSGKNDSLVFFESFNDTIYTITKNGISPRYKVKFKGEPNNVSQILDDQTVLNKTEIIGEKKLSSILNWLEEDAFILITYRTFSKKYGYHYVNQVLYNKKSCRCHAFRNGLKLQTYIDDFPFLFYGMTGASTTLTDDGKFSSLLQPAELIKRLDNEKADKNTSGPVHKFLKKFKLEKMKESDNPILFVFNFKERN